MNKTRHNSQLRRYFYRPLLVTALAVGGFLHFVTPLLANGAVAGTAISNTATATYEDPNQPGTSINTTSNTVVVTVAEVAGVTVTPYSITDRDGGVVLPLNIIDYSYKVTNVGNDGTQLFIPGTANVSGPGQAGTIQITGYLDPNGVFVAFPTPISVPANGSNTTTLGVQIGANPVGVIPAGFSLVVNVPVTVNQLASSGDTIAVRLGNTAPDGAGSTQNQPDLADGATTDEVRTIDVPGELGGSANLPANGEREASASQQILVGAQSQAFAAVLKTRSNYSDAGTAILSDDLLTYNLALRVDSTAPVGSTGLTPAALEGTTINVDGQTGPFILVSDAIPANTVLSAVPTTPANWRVVYTSTGTGTTANAATWTVTAPTTFPAAGITRVGFIYDPDNNLATASPAIAPGTTVNGFSFQVITSGVTNTTTIANVAQLFGQTQNGGTTLVYDESGDQSPANVNDNGTPGSNTPTNGVANPGTDGVDNNNNNTGVGPSGEANVFTLAAPGSILNGPNGQPAAVGPTNNNDDFTNQSVAIPANTAPGTLIDPAPVTFTNTFSNPSATTAIAGVLLVPDDAAATNTVPNGTTVSLTYGGQTAVYTYNGTDFIFTSGTAITVPSLAPGQSLNYTAVVDLPTGTPLSTDLNTPRGNLPSYPVSIHAFVDSAAGTPGSISGRPDATDATQNATIDRVYTGFLRMVKEARILDANGNQLEDFTTTPSTTNIRPGNIIEYRITYTNISNAAGGAGSRLLSATNVVISEDGVPSPTNTNNWAGDSDGDGVINTSNVIATAAASNGTITFLPSGDRSGTTVSTDVSQYVNTLGVIVEPQASGTFHFRRRIN